MNIKKCVIGTVLFLTCGGLFSQTPEMKTLTENTIQQDALLRQSLQHYSFNLDLLTQKLEREQTQPVRTKRLKALLTPKNQLNRFDYTLDSGIDPHIPANEKEKRIKLFLHILRLVDFEKLSPRFNLRDTGIETFKGIPCHVIAFNPKPDQPYHSREEKVINHLAGKIWISCENNNVIRVEAHLVQPIALAWFLATMRELSFCYNALFLTPSLAAPESISLLFDVQTTLTYTREQHFLTFSDYQPISSP